MLLRFWLACYAQCHQHAGCVYNAAPTFSSAGGVLQRCNHLLLLPAFFGPSLRLLAKHSSLPLQDEGFSDAIIDRFFRPFLGGIFFDRQLGTTSRLFSFVMRMLATGRLPCLLPDSACCA